MSAVYARTECAGDDITPGKLYLVRSGNDISGLFSIRDDADFEIVCLWQGCAHLSGGNWECVEGDAP